MTHRAHLLLVSLLIAGGATAQENTYHIITSNQITPNKPSATIQVWASFDPAQYGVWKCWFDLIASTDEGAFSDPKIILIGPGEQVGDVFPGGDIVTGVRIGQLHDPLAGIFADFSNPILMWQVTWSTSDFTPRQVSLTTNTVRYYLYVDSFGTAHNFTDTVVEGLGTITVVPAPGVASGLGVVILASARPRRRPTP